MYVSYFYLILKYGIDGPMMVLNDRNMYIFLNEKVFVFDGQ